MIPIDRNNIRSVYDELVDLEEELFHICSELEFPTYLLGNSVRYELATERRKLKNKINKLKESLYK